MQRLSLVDRFFLASAKQEGGDSNRQRDSDDPPTLTARKHCAWVLRQMASRFESLTARISIGRSPNRAESPPRAAPWVSPFRFDQALKGRNNNLNSCRWRG